MGEKHKVDIRVEYSINPLGGQHQGQLALYLHVVQPRPIYAGFISVTFYIPIIFARHVKLPDVDKITIGGKEFFMLRRSEEIDDNLLEELRQAASNPYEIPNSYSMEYVWHLPTDINGIELDQAKHIKWNLLACVAPTRLHGTIEKALHSS